MLKKLLFTALCTVALATSGYAADLKINAEVEAYYKQQTDYRTPLDSADYLVERTGDDAYFDSGYNYRSGANNRSQQNARAHGTVDFIGLAGENDYNGTAWYNFIGFMRLKIDANDPDERYKSDSEKDGHYADKSSLGDLWVRYSPAVMVGIKVGTQTIAATANAYGIGHKFVGDYDDDYVYYTASVLDEKPGISIDIHPTKDIELGVGMIQGMGDISSIVSGGSSAEAKNTVFWFDGNFGMVEATVGYQNVAVGGTSDAAGNSVDDEVYSQWEQEFKHTLTNAVVKVNIGDFSPFIGYIGGTGTSTEDKDISFSGQTLGLIAALGPGKLAAEYTKLTTPEFGEDGSVSAVIEVDSTLHLNYEIPITEGASITVFYNSLAAKEDSELRDFIDGMEALMVADPANALTYYANATSTSSLITTSHSSVGVSFQMKYGN